MEYYIKERNLLPEESKFNLAVNYLNSGITYYHLNNPKKSLECYKNAEEYSKQQNNEDFDQFIQKQKAYAFAKLNDYKSAFNIYKDASIRKDSIYTKRNADKILELESKYQAKMKQDSLDLLNVNQKVLNQEITLSKNRNKLLWSAIIIFMLLASLLYYFLRERSKNNKILILKNLEIRTLNKENIHRIKNNLSLLSSLMEMQTRRLDSLELKDIIVESENRVRVLTVLEKMLLSEEMENANIELKEYLTNIIDSIIGFNSIENRKVIANIKIDDIRLNADKSMKIGLIINELITNSIKHAKIIEDKLQIDLELKKDNAITMNYSDSGVEIDKQIDYENSDSLGLKLIKELTNQIHGTYEIIIGEGLKYRFYFDKLIQN
ncbi:MAG: sensor histidine kinase [Saprospiraceae bacterium]